MTALTAEQIAALVEVANGSIAIDDLEDRGTEMYGPLIDAVLKPYSAAFLEAEEAVMAHLTFAQYAPLDSASAERQAMEGRAMLIVGMLLVSPEKALALLGVEG